MIFIKKKNVGGLVPCNLFFLCRNFFDVMIWKVKPTREIIESYSGKSMESFLGIEITDVGDDYITGRMPVNEKTKQPLGLLHGGASCVLAETLGSIGGAFTVDLSQQKVLGLTLNVNHLRSATGGFVTGTATPVHLGATTQVWEIKIVNEQQKLVCIGRLTLAVRNI